MLKKYQYLVVGFAIILFVLPAVVMSARLDDPRTNRECYKSGLPFYVCVIEGTNIMEASFLTYEPMHDYYTPQLREVYYTVGNQAISLRERQYSVTHKTIETELGVMTITGAPSYLYVKGR